MESLTKEGDSPVHVIIPILEVSWVARNSWNSVWICRDHPVRLNTTERPIVNQYREGKVKRTSEEEWNSTWNHTLTSGRSIIYGVTACLLHNEPTSYSSPARLMNLVQKPKRKRVLTGRLVGGGRRETWWSTHGQVEVSVKRYGGPNQYTLKSVWMSCG